MATGVASGVMASFFLKLPIRGVRTDALLGMVGFLIGFAGIGFIRPLGYSVINYDISPPAVALVVAAIVPLSLKILRLRRFRSQ